MECMLMLSQLSLTVCGGIGVITPMAGAAILTMVGAVTLLIIATAAGALAGAASMAVGIGDGDTITIIIIIPAVAGIPVADTGEVATGAEVVCTQTDVLMEIAYLPEIVYPVHLQPVVRQEQVVIRLVVVQAPQVEK